MTCGRAWLGRLAALGLALSWSATALPAPDTAPNAPASSPATTGKDADTACYPPCRAGFLCHDGWLQHKMSHDVSSGSGSAAFRLSQGVFNIGFIFAD